MEHDRGDKDFVAAQVQSSAACRTLPSPLASPPPAVALILAPSFQHGGHAVEALFSEVPISRQPLRSVHGASRDLAPL